MRPEAAIFETLQAFDRHAPSYVRWEQHPSAQHWRARVISCCIQHFPPNGRVLDVGGGTGVDALLLMALGYRVTVLEPSAGMGDIARSRGVVVVTAGAEDLDTLPIDNFEGVLSNFGALNCVPDLERFARGLRIRLGVGGVAVLVVMGPFALSETILLAGTGRFRALARRRRAAVVPLGEGTVPVSWWGRRALCRALLGFRLIHTEALGSVLPPPDIHAGNALLRRLDTAVAPLPGFRQVGDHTLYVFRRVS
jgi:SAM-dependent methyltransferase